MPRNRDYQPRLGEVTAADYLVTGRQGLHLTQGRSVPRLVSCPCAFSSVSFFFLSAEVIVDTGKDARGE